MNKSYIYQGPPEGQKSFGALPEGDYAFTVSSADAPYYKNDKWILALKIIIQPQGVPVFANPWSGKTSAGEERDGIAEFLLAINRAPQVGQEPEWGKLVGARGKCRLKIEIAQMGNLAGREVNKVSYFHRPKQLTSEQELPKVGPKPPEDKDELDMGPSDIPFRSTIYKDVKQSRLSRRYVL